MSDLLKLMSLVGLMLFTHLSEAKKKNHSPVYLNSSGALPSGLPFSEAVKLGDTVYLSGQIGTIPGESKLAEGGIRAETIQTMKNIKAVLNKHDLTMNDLVKCTVMLADISEWATFNEEYRKFFPKHFPARSAFGASGLALGARVEVECIAGLSH